MSELFQKCNLGFVHEVPPGETREEEKNDQGAGVEAAKDALQDAISDYGLACHPNGPNVIAAGLKVDDAIDALIQAVQANDHSAGLAAVGNDTGSSTTETASVCPHTKQLCDRWCAPFDCGFW